MTSGAWRRAARKRRREVGRVVPDLHLLDDAALVRVLELDGVLDGHDVTGLAAVDLLDDGGERGALADAGRAPDEDEAAGKPS